MKKLRKKTPVDQITTSVRCNKCGAHHKAPIDKETGFASGICSECSTQSSTYIKNRDTSHRLFYDAKNKKTNLPKDYFNIVIPV